MAVLAPMPNASDNTATAANNGLRRMARRAKRRSWATLAISALDGAAKPWLAEQCFGGDLPQILDQYIRVVCRQLLPRRQPCAHRDRTDAVCLGRDNIRGRIADQRHRRLRRDLMLYARPFDRRLRQARAILRHLAKCAITKVTVESSAL